MENSLPFAQLNEAELPHSLESEQAVLGCVLKEPECMAQVMLILKPEYFFLPRHQAIFSAMVSIDATGNKVDPLVLLEILRRDQIFRDEEGKEYLFRLLDAVPSTANVEAYAITVRDKYYVRTLIEAARDIVSSAMEQQDSPDMLLDSAEQRIYDIRRGRTTSGPAQIGDIIVNEVYDHLHKITSENKEEYLGTSTGFSGLDKVISGLNKSDLVIIGARPAMGKTSFALNMALNVALKARKKVLFFSLEMNKEQLAQRVLSMQSRVQGFKMRSGELDPDDWVRLGEATIQLNDCPLYFDDTSTITAPEMKARVRRMKDVDCIFIDYLQLMKSGNRIENRVQEVSDITRNLKLMAKDLNIPVVTLAQLSRVTEGRGKSHRPQMSDLRESGSIEQDADIIMMLYRDDYYDNEEKEGEQVPNQPKPTSSVIEVIVAKNRHGPTETVKLGWNSEFTLFTTLAENFGE